MSDVASWEVQGNRHLDLAAAPVPRAHHRLIAELALEFGGGGARVLDVGCGRGEIAGLLRQARPGWTLHVADAYPRCLEVTRERVQPAACHLLEEGRFSLAGIPRDFELVILSHVLEHMLDPVAALRETLSVLRPGGHLIVAVPNPVRPSVFLAALRQRDYVNRGHVVAWDRAHWINFLERILQLEVVRYASDAVPLFPERLKRRLGVLERGEVFLARLLPWLSFSNVAVIRKA